MGRASSTDGIFVGHIKCHKTGVPILITARERNLNTLLSKGATNPLQPRRTHALILMIVASIGASFGGLIVRSLETDHTASINLVRSIALVTTILAILRWTRGRAGWQTLRDIGPKGFSAGMVLGAAGIFFLLALLNTHVANVFVIVGVTPLLSAALALVVLGETIGRPTLAALICGLTGIGIMMFSDLGSPLSFGNLMALLTACGYAVFSVLLRAGRERDMLPTILIAGLVIILFSLVQGVDLQTMSTRDVALCLLWGGVFSAGAHWLVILASRVLKAAELTLFMLLEIALAPVLVWLAVGEVPTFPVLIGGLCVVIGIILPVIASLRATNWSEPLLQNERNNRSR